MPVLIPDEIVKASHMTEDELLQEMAIVLYQKQKITLARASKLAKMNRLQFQHLLASRDININLNVEDLKHDIETLKSRVAELESKLAEKDKQAEV